MRIEPGIGLLLNLPYADGGMDSKQRPYLVIGKEDNSFMLLNISSVAGKERKVLFDSNYLIKQYNPPFLKPSFVKLDAIYKVEICSALNNFVLCGGNKLNAAEMVNLLNAFEKYRSTHCVNVRYFTENEIQTFNARRYIAAEREK